MGYWVTGSLRFRGTRSLKQDIGGILSLGLWVTRSRILRGTGSLGHRALWNWVSGQVLGGTVHSLGRVVAPRAVTAVETAWVTPLRHRIATYNPAQVTYIN